MSVYLPLALVFVAVMAATFAVAFGVEALRVRRHRKSLAERLENLQAEANREIPGLDVRRSLADATPLMQALAGRFPGVLSIGLVLEQADLTWTVQRFLVLSAGFAVGFGIVAYFLGGSLLVAAAGVAFGALLPYLYVRRARARRLRRFEELLPEAIDLMGRALRAGHPFTAGIKLVGEESAPPVSTEFERLFEEQRFGLPLPDALLGLADRISSLDVRIFITAVLIQREVGGNLAEVLDKLGYTIRERFRIRREIRTRTAQGRMTGYLLAVLPFAAGALLFAINPHYMMPLFKETLGHILIAAALILQMIGFFWIKKIVDIEV